MSLSEHRRGVLLMLAGLSKRAEGAPIKPNAIKVWLQEEATDGIIDREIAWLFRAGYITSVDGDAFSIREAGWAALDEYLLDLDETEREMEAKFGKYSVDGPATPAKDESDTVLLLLGEGSLKYEAQRMTNRAFPRSSPGSTS